MLGWFFFCRQISLKIVILANLGQLTRHKFRVSGDLIPLRNRSELVEGGLIAIYNLLLGANLSLCTLYGVWGDDSHKNYLLHLIFSCYYCSVELRRQLEHSELHPDTSNLVIFYLHEVETTITKSNGRRTNKTARIQGQIPECYECPCIYIE